MALSRLREIPVFRYEDGFVGSVETFDRVAALLGTSPSEDDRKAILARLAPEAVRKTINGLEAVGTIRGEKIWDSGTLWHAKHVGDGKVGKFKTILSPTQQREIMKQTREFCDRFGYDTTVDTNPEQHSDAFAASAPIKQAPTLLSAPIELVGDWGHMIPRSADKVIKRMRPPFARDNKFGNAIAGYRQNIIQRYATLADEQGMTHDLAKWFADHRSEIERNSTLVNPSFRVSARRLLFGLIEGGER